MTNNTTLPDPLGGWFRKIGTTLSDQDYEDGIRLINELTKAREEAERRVQVQAQATSSACLHASEYAKRMEAAEARADKAEQERNEALAALKAESEIRGDGLAADLAAAVRRADAAEAAYAALVARINALADKERLVSTSELRAALTEKEQDRG